MEKDPYVKAFVLCVLQYGWRPENQLAHLRWHHVHYQDGRMDHLEADGVEARFKSASPILARLPDDVRQALEAWRGASPAAGEDDWIFPWRDAHGTLRPAAPATGKALDGLWRRFRAKHDLAVLRPVDCRHFVKTGLRRLGLSDPAMAAWQGHKSMEGGMRATYDNPQVEALLDEQATAAPRGPLALLIPPEIHDQPGLPREAVAIVRALLGGTMSDLEAAAALGKLRTKLAKAPSLLEP
jgi:hypothetical protein